VCPLTTLGLLIDRNDVGQEAGPVFLDGVEQGLPEEDQAFAALAEWRGDQGADEFEKARNGRDQAAARAGVRQHLLTHAQTHQMCHGPIFGCP
jgi:hypothetical protein